jgi:hypothetical protein
MKTRDEIEQLKAAWDYDPLWDLDRTEGFEEHAEELREHQAMREREATQQREQEIANRAKKLNCSRELVMYIERLEWQVEAVQSKLDDLIQRCGFA